MKTLNTYITEKFVDINNYNVDKRKYELTDNSISGPVKKLYQIRALKTFKTIDGKIVKKGDLGGYIESEANLSHEGNCWVADDATVLHQARVYDDALVYGHSWIYDKAQVYGEARIYDNAEIYDNTKVYGEANVGDKAKVYGKAHVYGNAHVYGKAKVHGNAEVCGDSKVDYDVDSGKINK